MKLDDLRKHEDVILLAEIGALIHDLGKLSEEFIESMSMDSNNRLFCHHLILKRITNNYHSNAVQSRRVDELRKKESMIPDHFLPHNLIDMLNCKTEIRFPFNIGECNLGDFIEQHEKRGDSFWGQRKRPIELLAPPGCDAVDSGIDKSTPVKKQMFHETFISTAFGHEAKKIVPSNLELERKGFCTVFEDQLQIIIEAISNREMNAIRKARKEILEAARNHFSHVLGETRRAANDVTLWDHSYSVASLYKSALAGIILEHQNSQDFTLPEPENLKWRILFIHINGADFWMKSDKIGDIKARKNLIEDSFKRIKVLIEEEIPLGNEIYCDENCIAFLVFENFSKEFEIVSENKTIEEKILDIFKVNSSYELRPSIEVSQESRGATTIGELLKKCMKFNKSFGENLGEHWTNLVLKNENNKEIEICRVCGLRAVGFPQNKESEKAKKRHICSVCLERRENRSKDWIEKSRKGTDTLWIDEVSDSNNRVALIVGQFDLENWLDSTYLNTIFTKTLPDLHNLEKGGLEGINGYYDLLDAARQSFNSENIKIGHIKKERKEFLKSIGRESYQNEDIESYFKTLVLDREEERLVKELGSPDTWSVNTKAALLVSFLFRKNPSFARTRRIWESALDFWENIDEKIRRGLARDCRYEITFRDSMDVSVSHTYYLKVSGSFVPTVASEKGKMLIVEKKEKLLHIMNRYIEEEEKQLNKEIEVFESDKKTLVGKGEIEKIERHSIYIPYINILKEPSVFISLVPAAEAFDAARKIKEDYEIQFSKVRNRLPMNVYLIFMNKKMPLYIALNSARRFLEFKNISESWEISKISNKSKNGIIEKRKLNLKKGNSFETEIDLLLGNDETDYYHPYFIVKEGNCPDERESYFETYRGEKLVHVEELIEGDTVEYIPSFFDFVFLDTNTRRFDIYMEDKKRPHPIFKLGPRPYYLEDIDKFCKIWDILKKTCDKTQLNNFESILLLKIEEWNLNDLKNLQENEEFRKLVEASIKNILGIRREDFKFEYILNSVLTGMFFDIKELFHTILKEKLRGEENE